MGSITYTDIIRARSDAIEDGNNVSHVLLTENTIESIVDGSIPVVDDAEQIEGDESRLAGIDVEEGERNELVTDDGSVYSL